MKQHTIGNTFILSGKGLHTGLSLTARFMPLPDNEGIRICRSDLPGRPTYQAVADYVSATDRGTVLSCGEWKVSTVEHVLSALYAVGVDNCFIEVDGPEMPILDGSARLIVEALQNAGLREQTAEREYLHLTKPVTFENKETGSLLTLIPSDRLSMEVTISFGSPVLGEQTAQLRQLDDYTSQIAAARTFCFVREIEPLLKLGYIKGGDLENAIVIYDKAMPQEQLDQLANSLGQTLHRDASQLGYLTTLNFDNEPARHKLLDLIGDLSLIGKRIHGHVVAFKPGHTSNTHFAKQIRQLMQNPKS